MDAILMTKAVKTLQFFDFTRFSCVYTCTVLLSIQVFSAAKSYSYECFAEAIESLR